MEAEEITEQNDTTATMDVKELPSTKHPANEDLQALPTSETPLEPFISQTSLESFPDSSISQTALEIQVSKNLLQPATPETLLESHTTTPPSQTTLVRQASESPSKPSIPMTSLEKPIFDISSESSTAETDISKDAEKHLIFLPSSVTPTSPSPSDALREDFLFESSTSEIPELEHLLKNSLLGPSAQVYMDTSAKQKEETEDKDIVDTTDITAHIAQARHQLGKKKKKRKKKRTICSTSHSVVPAKQTDLVEMAKAMNREKCGADLNHLFQWEKDATLNAIQTGLYISWRCPHYLWDCYRIGDESKCFCGHLLRQHHIISDISVPCAMSQCRCLIFCFIPSRPEEVGEFWLRRRATFNPKAWRAQCCCKHSHEEHAASGAHPCRHQGCTCNCFESNFLCAACDQHWEEHETFFETKKTHGRRRRPHGGKHTVANWHRPF